MESVQFVSSNPSPTPPHKGEGLNPWLRSASIKAGSVPRVLSPLVGEMAGRPEGVFGQVRLPSPCVEGLGRGKP
jgi:cobaltochelatase CobN